MLMFLCSLSLPLVVYLVGFYLALNTMFLTGEPGVPDILPDRVRLPGDHPADLQALGMSDGPHRRSLGHSFLLPWRALEEETLGLHDHAV